MVQKQEPMKEERKIRLELQVSTLWKAGTFIFALLFVISLLTGGFQGSQDRTNIAQGGSAQGGNQPFAAGPQGPQAPGAGQQAQQKIVAVSEDDDPVMGDEDADVTIIEFSDYQCPFCEKFYSQTLPQLKKDYIDTGKVKLVYRDYPLPFHPFAEKAAEAANCAGEQGKYFAMHDKIFANQATLNEENLKVWGASIGLDANKFNSCLDSGKMAAEIAKDLADGNAAGVSGTPSFFVNGKILVGAQPFAAFKTVIDQELAR